MILELKNLSITRQNQTLLQEINLKVESGSINVIIGPNGAGKSTLLNSIMGNPSYEISSGEIILQGENINNTPVADRANKGLFISFQNPISIPGISNIAFYKAILQNQKKYLNQQPLTSAEIIKIAKSHLSKVGLDESFLKRSMNDDFSGGEKKRNELAQMLLLQPKLSLLDEIDSGLDIEAIKNFSNIINYEKSQGKTFIIVTHYGHFMKMLDVDKIHILNKGSIAASGSKELIDLIQEDGFKIWS